MWPDGFQFYRAGEVRTINLRASEISPVQVRAPEIHIRKVRVRGVGAKQRRPLEIGPRNIRASEFGIRKIGLSQISAGKVHANQIGAIERAIQSANLGLNPANDGKVVRIPLPPLTDDRRKELSRIVHSLVEDGRTAVRGVRRQVNDALKKLLKTHAISEDDERRALDEVQKVTDAYIQEIDSLQKTKDTELLEH